MVVVSLLKAWTRGPCGGIALNSIPVKHGLGDHVESLLYLCEAWTRGPCGGIALNSIPVKHGLGDHVEALL